MRPVALAAAGATAAAVRAIAAVSRDGSWVVVPTATRQGEALLFIGMGTSPFSA